MNHKNIVFLSYGRSSEYLRAIFSILSLLAWKEEGLDDFRIIVYTDDPDFFKRYLVTVEVIYVLLTSDLLEEMLGGTSFLHRRKVAAIDLTFKKYPEDNLFFIDSDTFFISNPKRLLTDVSSLNSFMHKREYTYEEGLAIFSSFNQAEFPKAFIDYISDRDIIIGETAERFTKLDYSWNSGVLGLHHSFIQYMPDIFKLSDAFYENSSWFISEQIAFSLILQRKTVLHEADAFVLHYWGKRQKELMDKQIIDFLADHQAIYLKKPALIRRMTKRWKFLIETDIILEKAVIALSYNSWLYGIKKSVQVVLKNPFSLVIYKELITAACLKRE